MPNKLSQFWQELKRRKVVRVITVFAAASFVILELLSIIIEPLRLPEWTLQFAIVFLCIGFIIAIILSWIFDIHPEGGIVKTEPAHKLKTEGIPKSSNSWKIASYISFVVIVGLIVLNVIPSRSKDKEVPALDKTIAVLPFKNDSQDETNTDFINGTMESILNNLSKIKELEVRSRLSVEQFRDSNLTAPEIAEKLNVNYILEGSMQKYGNQIRMTIQLIDKDDIHLWSEQYDREIKGTKEYFDLQSEIAQLVAVELHATITPREKQLIEKIPTTNVTAYDFYQRGREEFIKYRLDIDNSEALKSAEEFFHKALEYDSTFAKAYTGLAWVHRTTSRKSEFFSESYMDSLLILAEIALLYDSQLADAHTIMGMYFRSTNQLENALIEFNRALELNPNDWMAYVERGWLYYWHYDLVQSLHDFHKAAQLNRGAGLSEILHSIAIAFSEGLGFKEKGLYYNQQALELDGDSARYYRFLSDSEHSIGNYEVAIELLKKSFEIDTNHLGILGSLGDVYLYIGEMEESLYYFKKYLETIESKEGIDFHTLNVWHRIGYAYLKNGNIKEAEYYFDRQLEYCNKSIELGRPYGLDYVYYDLATLNAIQGDKAMAFDNLNVFKQMKVMPLSKVIQIKGDPLLDNIRDEPEFQQIVSELEAKFQAEHERARQWLEENVL